LEQHPQHGLAKELFGSFSAIMSFSLKNEEDCLPFLNRLQLVIKSSNLGDNRTLAIPVAQTIFFELGAERRKEMGLPDSLIRLSVGIEDFKDLKEDFENALGQKA
jgi:O-acetylhomoserine (thiol)-lyase